MTLVILGLVVWPSLRDPPQDSFPLSDYPMFSRGRPSPEMDVTHALAVTADGRRIPLSPLLSAGNREVLQSMVSIARAVHGGPEPARDFCSAAARRVAAAGEPALAGATHVELATSHYDAVAYFATGPEPLSRRVHVRCEVP